MSSNKVLLLILDGWGVSSSEKGNAIKAADIPYYNHLLKTCPNTLLEASGVYVGLPEGIMGNSEVGHENIGAGRINKQKLTMISDMLRSGEFFENKVLNQAVDHALKTGSRLHFMGLISEGDVHSHLGHLDGLIELARRRGLNDDQVYLQAITDGRDDPPRVAEKLMHRYESKIQIATVSGRYWAMDRDNNADRIQKYLDCVISAQGLRSSTASQAIRDAYALADAGKNPTGDSDEFILPTIVNPQGVLCKGDAIVFFNFRPDRAKQISKALGMDTKDFHYVCFTDYADEFDLPVAYSSKTLPEQDMTMSLGEYISSLGFNQFRTAETEKFNHVTSFFNQRRKKPFAHEDWAMVPSPKVSTYDLQPEMSVKAVADGLIAAMQNRDKNYKLVVCNFANPDMVGHTGSWDAVLKALSAVDYELRRVVEAAQKEAYSVLVTADHGNADQMLDADGTVRTAHSCNPVPLILVDAVCTDDSASKRNLRPYKADPKDLSGSNTLSNIAPTILDLMGLTKPQQMKADSLLS